MKNPKPAVLLMGATSDMGRAIARAFAAHGHPLHLAARDLDRLAGEAQDMRVRSGGAVTIHRFDALTDDPAVLLAGLEPFPGIVICVIGLMGGEDETIMRTNYMAPALALEAAARAMAARGGGVIVGVSSVAGDRGRGSNYVYGSAKAGLTAYLSGLRAKYRELRVVTVKPGFVDTRMTAGMDLPKMLTAQPDEVASAILKAVERGPEVIYVRPVWRLIMTIIRLLPEPVFKRVKV